MDWNAFLTVLAALVVWTFLLMAAGASLMLLGRALIRRRLRRSRLHELPCAKWCGSMLTKHEQESPAPN